MPGFQINGVGVGPNSLAEVRRAHRWVFESMTNMTAPVLLVLKSASRPSITFEEPAMHHDQEQVYFAGKHTWEPLTLTWYDVEQDPNVSKALWDKLGTVIDFTNAGQAVCVKPPSAYKGIAKLQLRSGCGQGDVNEEWGIYNGWPQTVNWNSVALDYSVSDLLLVEMKYRYDRAVRTK